MGVRDLGRSGLDILPAWQAESPAREVAAPRSGTHLARESRPAAALTIIVPVYNEEENFPVLVAEVERHVAQPFTLFMVYDTDEDRTLPVARRLAEERPWIKFCKNTIGRGPGNALRAGFASAPPGPALVLMADLSDDLSLVPRMLELYSQGYQVVCPSRYMKGGRQIGGPWLKRSLSRAAGLSLRWLVRFPTHDATNNYRLYDAQLVRELGIESQGGFSVALELTAKAFRRGSRIAQLPCTWRDRSAGTSTFQLRKWLPQYLRWYFYALGAGASR